MKESKQGAPGSVRLFASAGKGPAGVMNSLPRARTRVVGLGSSPTEILKESLCSRTTGARTRVCDGGADAPADVIEAVLGRLPERDKAFARAVLDGKRWREMGIGKRGFNKRLAKICSRLGSHLPAKPSLKT